MGWTGGKNRIKKAGSLFINVGFSQKGFNKRQDLVVRCGPMGGRGGMGGRNGWMKLLGMPQL